MFFHISFYVIFDIFKVIEILASPVFIADTDIIQMKRLFMSVLHTFRRPLFLRRIRTVRITPTIINQMCCMLCKFIQFCSGCCRCPVSVCKLTEHTCAQNREWLSTHILTKLQDLMITKSEGLHITICTGITSIVACPVVCNRLSLFQRTYGPLPVIITFSSGVTFDDTSSRKAYKAWIECQQLFCQIFSDTLSICIVFISISIGVLRT